MRGESVHGSLRVDPRCARRKYTEGRVSVVGGGESWSVRVGARSEFASTTGEELW